MPPQTSDASTLLPDALATLSLHQQPPRTHPPKVPQPVRGLRNLGNTCFLNSTLQNLLAAQGLRHFFRDNPPTDADGPVTTAMRAWVKQMHDGGAAAVSPSALLRAVSVRHRRFAGRSQQDAQEVLRNLLESVRDEEEKRLKPPGRPASATSKPPPTPPTIVDEVFGGEFRSSVVCLNCHTLSASHEPFLDLSLPVTSANKAGASSRLAGSSEPTVKKERRRTLRRLAASLSRRSSSDRSEQASESEADAELEGQGAEDGSQASTSARDEDSWVVVGRKDGEPAGGWRRASEVGVAVASEQVLGRLPRNLIQPAEELSLESCVQEFSRPEILHHASGNAFHCEVCEKRAKDRGASAEQVAKEKLQPAVRFFQLTKLPPVLTLHLKRFSAQGSRASKISTSVPFPQNLDLSPFCAGAKTPKTASEISSSPDLSGVSPRYALSGVVVHQGSLLGGHYTTYVRNESAGDRTTSSWHHFSDTLVTTATEQDALAAQAFLLFYTRVDD